MSDPYEERYTSKEMQDKFSREKKFSLWRRFWLALARNEKDLGVEGITEQALKEMEANVDNLNLERADEIERDTKHDVVAHIRAYGEQCPSAKGIIHVPCTSRDPTDNCELLQLKEGMELVRYKLAHVIDFTADKALGHRELAMLGRTHYQPAELTTLGRRLAIHGEEMLLAFDNLQYVIENLPFRGLKGAVGTQSTFLDLFDGDEKKVAVLEERMANEFGFKHVLHCTGQTYHRMIDYQIASALGMVAIGARRFANTVRLLQGLGEIEEPFGKKQTGSSAMPWKRNPKDSERLSSISYAVLGAAHELGECAANQWLEGSVEDSALRRIKLREAFFATDAVLELYAKIIQGLNVYERKIDRNLSEKLPYIVLNALRTEAIKRGGDSQALHEKLRTHAMDALQKEQGEAGIQGLLPKMIIDDPEIPLDETDVHKVLTEYDKLVGRAVAQVEEFAGKAQKVKVYVDGNYKSKVSV